VEEGKFAAIEIDGKWWEKIVECVDSKVSTRATGKGNRKDIIVLIAAIIRLEHRRVTQKHPSNLIY
jgi:hypothetical protein